MTFEEIDFVLSPATRKMAQYGKTKKDYMLLVEQAIEEVLNMASKEVGLMPEGMLGKVNVGTCKCCHRIVYSSENYCSECGMKLIWK